MSIWKAAAASGLVAFIVTLSSTLLASGGRMYVAEVDWAKVDTMNYREANDYLLARSRAVSRWKSLRDGSGYPAFWQSMFADGTLNFLVGVATCVVYRRLDRRKFVSSAMLNP